MLTSSLASIDLVELQEIEQIQDTSGRGSADPEVVSITYPRETTSSASGEVIDELEIGKSVNFRAFLRNSGDEDLTNMQYRVSIYTDEDGTRGNIAKDSNGYDLVWENHKAVCIQSCQETSVAPGDFVGGGELTLLTPNGNIIEWIPSELGRFHVIISVSSIVLGDPSNDELSVLVTVVDSTGLIAAISITCTPSSINIPVYPGANSTGNTICSVMNPTLYQEIVQFNATTSDPANLTIDLVENITINAGENIDITVNVSTLNEIRMNARTLSIKGTVIEINGSQPANVAISNTNMIVNILQYDNLSIIQETLSKTVMINVNKNFEFNQNISIDVNAMNNGNGFDYAKVGIKNANRLIWEEDNFSLTIPLVKVLFEPFSEGEFSVILSLSEQTNFDNWEVLDNGTLYFSRDLTIFAESEFGCNYGNCNTNEINVTIIIFHLGFLDSDGDGVDDMNDAFPLDVAEWLDSDGDGIGDNSDWAPFDSNETTDSDNDGVGDNTDVFPNDSSETEDSDGDGVGDNSDWAPFDSSETKDSDNDGVGDNTDVFPNDSSETKDSDGDGVGDNSDDFPNNPNVQYIEDIKSSSESNNSTNLIAIAILVLALVIFIVARKQKTDNKNEEETGNKKKEDSKTTDEYEQKIPPFDFVGKINEDGWEVCEYPANSGTWWWKDHEGETWVLWE